MSKYLRESSRIVAILIALFPQVVVASDSDRVLSGKMSWWNNMVGHWVCDVTLDGASALASQKGRVLAEGSVAPGNAFHLRVTAPGIEVDQYNGYSRAKSEWWESQAGSTGLALMMLSVDGRHYREVPGPSSVETGHVLYTETYSFQKRSGIFAEFVQRFSNGSWHRFSEQSCSRFP